MKVISFYNKLTGTAKKQYIIRSLDRIIDIFSKYKENDPVKNCNVYKTAGCAHVDGLLCNMETCNIKISVTTKQTEQSI